MLKVALVNPPQFTRYPQPPMGLALLAAVLERAGYPVMVIEANALNLQPEAVVPLVADADVIGLTAMTPTINTAITLARHLKKARPDVLIILGGAHATLLPEETLNTAPEIDILVRGEGEETILEVSKALENKHPITGIAGVSYRKDGRVISNPARSGNTDLNALPFLAYHLLPQRRYRPHPPHGRAFPFAAIITSRGCPYHCSYCSKPIFGTRFRGQSSERVIEELAYLEEKFGIKEFAFYDDVFTLDKKRAQSIAEGIIKKGLKIDWTCETRVNLVDRELLRDINKAGCYSVAYGIESGSPEILNTLDKDISTEQVEEAVRWSREAGLQVIGYFMVGSPGETPETIRQTIQFAKKLRLDFAQFAVTTPFPGTKLYNLYMDAKKSEKIPWENFVYAGSGKGVTPVFESSLLSRDDIQYWAKRAYREFYLRLPYVWQRIRHTTSFGDLRVDINGLLMLLESLRGGRR